MKDTDSLITRMICKDAHVSIRLIIMINLRYLIIMLYAKNMHLTHLLTSLFVFLATINSSDSLFVAFVVV